MPTALYYPHTTIRDAHILKSALLLWDRIECIAPECGKRQHRFDDQRLNQATELVVRDHVPTPVERKEVHDAVVALVRHGIPDWFRLYPDEHPLSARPYPIYPDKLSNETWRLLEDRALSEWRGDGHGVVSEPLGLLIMSLLADACAGIQKQRVTDRADAYAKLNAFLGAAAGGLPITRFDESHGEDHYEALISVSIRVLSADDIPLDALLNLRVREARESGTDLQQFRRRYAAKISEALTNLVTQARTDADREAILADFEFEMRDDFGDLKSELRLARSKALTTRDVVLTAAALLGVGIGFAIGYPSLAALATVARPAPLGSLLSARTQFTAARRKALRNHAMSWLYLADAASYRIVTRP